MVRTAHPTELGGVVFGFVVRTAHPTGLGGLVLGVVVRAAHPGVDKDSCGDAVSRRKRRAHRIMAADVFTAPLPGR